MATSDLKGDFGGYLDAQIDHITAIIEDIDKGGDWITPRQIYVGMRLALQDARKEFWQVIER